MQQNPQHCERNRYAHARHQAERKRFFGYRPGRYFKYLSCENVHGGLRRHHEKSYYKTDRHYYPIITESAYLISYKCSDGQKSNVNSHKKQHQTYVCIYKTDDDSYHRAPVGLASENAEYKVKTHYRNQCERDFFHIRREAPAEEQKKMDAEAEEIYRKELKERCEKKGIDYDAALEKHIEAVRVKQEKQTEKERLAKIKAEEKAKISADKKAAKLAKMSPEQRAKSRASWNHWDVIHTVIILSVIAIFYYYFW